MNHESQRKGLYRESEELKAKRIKRGIRKKERKREKKNIKMREEEVDPYHDSAVITTRWRPKQVRATRRQETVGI